MAFARNEEKEKWQTFVENAFSKYSIKWIYGDESIGKSTILRAVVWDLQQKWKKTDRESKQQLFYVDLENQINPVPEIVESLSIALDENAAKGIKSCVVFGMLCFVAHFPKNEKKMKFPTISVYEFRFHWCIS